MGKKNKSTQETNTTQNSSTSYGSTGTANSWLDDFQNAFRDSLNVGPYTGDTVATQDLLDRYTPTLGNITGTVADPGEVNQWAPTIDILDRYVAGLSDTSREGIQGGIDFTKGIAPTITNTANNMAGFWNDVSSGKYLDPSQNQSLQGYLNTFADSSQDQFARSELAQRQGAVESGAYGDDSYRRAAMWRGDEQNQNIQNQISAILYKNYDDEMARRERASAGSSDALTLGEQPWSILDSLGERQRFGDQLDINNEIATGQERERADLAGFQNDERIRNQTALRDQAGLDNSMGMARWQQEQSALDTQNDILRAQVDQGNRQAGLTNDMARHDQAAGFDMGMFDQFFRTLANPVFGTNTRSTGNQTTTTTTPGPSGLQTALGALSGVAGVASMFNPAAGGISALLKGFGGANSGATPGQAGIPQAPAMPAVQMPNYSGYQAPATPAPGALPWYLQPGAFTMPSFSYGG